MPTISFDVGDKVAQLLLLRYEVDPNLTPAEKLAAVREAIKRDLRDQLINWALNDPESPRFEEGQSGRQAVADDLRTDTPD